KVKCVPSSTLSVVSAWLCELNFTSSSDSCASSRVNPPQAEVKRKAPKRPNDNPWEREAKEGRSCCMTPVECQKRATGRGARQRTDWARGRATAGALWARRAGTSVGCGRHFGRRIVVQSEHPRSLLSRAAAHSA